MEHCMWAKVEESKRLDKEKKKKGSGHQIVLSTRRRLDQTIINGDNPSYQMFAEYKTDFIVNVSWFIESANQQWHQLALWFQAHSLNGKFNNSPTRTGMKASETYNYSLQRKQIVQCTQIQGLWGSPLCYTSTKLLWGFF